MLDDSQKILFASFTAIKKFCNELSDVDNFIEKFVSLEFVVIVSPSDEDAYQLFEGLNSTGLSLSAVELTKNSILGKIKNLDSSRIGEAVNIWTSIEKSFEDTNIIWFNKFLRHQWFSRNGYVNNANLFRDIKSEIINKNGIIVNDLFGYLEELKKDSLIYISLRTANLSKSDYNSKMHVTAWDSVLKLINFIEKLGLDQVYSVLLALCKYGKSESEYFKRGDTFQKHIEKLWQFLLIVKYTKISPASFEKDFSEICKNVQGKPYNEFKILMQDFFIKLSSKVSGLQEDFSINLNESVDYSIDDKGIIKFLLEEYLLTEGEGSDNDIEMEHIVPENNLDEWTNVIDKGSLSLCVEKLGNLTLLRDTLNRDAGHKNFDEKERSAYSKSRFTVNNKLKDEWGEKFNSPNPLVEAINPRGLLIGRVVYNTYYTNLSN